MLQAQQGAAEDGDRRIEMSHSCFRVMFKKE